jgi:SAM-dependent methyltransferase
LNRSKRRLFLDFLTFPVRAVTLFEQDKWGLSSLATERFDYVARFVKGYCLDVGCGRNNRFIRDFREGYGKGIDVFPYEGLLPENLVEDISTFPFDSATFETVTFIANINHIPKPLRDVELAEAFRCLKGGGRIIVTMGHPLAEILVHKVVWAYDRLFGTNHDMDSERGMHEEEEYYLTDDEILNRLNKAGFGEIKKKYFLTQWGLNHLFIGVKR